MQGIMETLFDVVYLITVTSIGVWMISNAKENKQYRLFGWMAVILGVGDAFHLIPRAYGLLTIGLEANATALGIGKLITSITMTIFYVFLYKIYSIRYQKKNTQKLTSWIYFLAAVRIVLVLLPQNDWLNYNQPLSWGIYRNIPFAILGITLIWLFYKDAKKHNDIDFKYMWLAITLSFLLYAPVVLFASTYPLVGILMIPKTIAYVWVVFMGFKGLKRERKRI
jgi:uncharacterized membrane protein